MEFPKNAKQWAYFIAAVFIAGVAISSIARRVPQVAQVAGGF